MTTHVTVGVLALQGAFSEHIHLLKQAFLLIDQAEAPVHGSNGASDTGSGNVTWHCTEVRTPDQLGRVDALIIPGGESTTMALIAARSGLLEPLRSFVKVQRKNVWGTCAGMILLAEAANRTKKDGQELIGGLDVRVNRNHFGRQVESFETDIQLPFLNSQASGHSTRANAPFKGVFIRAPIVERILPLKEGMQDLEEAKPDTVIAPSRTPNHSVDPSTVNRQVEVLATLSDRSGLPKPSSELELLHQEDIIAVRQGNVVATSFHPELTNDARMHVWWLEQVRAAVLGVKSSAWRRRETLDGTGVVDV